ncbi:hypothetical protein RDI58_016816 [Solanum bulbocastanum]|uniref:Uncharacterized protein n=1 Tax=Solanum bulbocastanum TaxID=147425 RepID=A0AAN8YE37_SOLBU
MSKGSNCIQKIALIYGEDTVSEIARFEDQRRKTAELRSLTEEGEPSIGEQTSFILQLDWISLSLIEK